MRVAPGLPLFESNSKMRLSLYRENESAWTGIERQRVYD
jgi:hypothetical protein